MSQDKASREISARDKQAGTAVSPIDRFRRYVEDIRLEMKPVSWPSWKEVRSTTFIVLFFTFAMAAFFKVIDVIAALLYKLVTGR